MKIADYLKEHGLDEESFAALSGGAFSAEAVRKWRFGARVPRTRQMLIISRLTDGAVTPNDFMPEPVAVTAADQDAAA